MNLCFNNDSSAKSYKLWEWRDDDKCMHIKRKYNFVFKSNSLFFSLQKVVIFQWNEGTLKNFFQKIKKIKEREKLEKLIMSVFSHSKGNERTTLVFVEPHTHIISLFSQLVFVFVALNCGTSINSIYSSFLISHL